MESSFSILQGILLGQMVSEVFSTTNLHISSKLFKTFSIEEWVGVISSKRASEKSVVMNLFVRAEPKEEGWSALEMVLSFETLRDSFSIPREIEFSRFISPLSARSDKASPKDLVINFLDNWPSLSNCVWDIELIYVFLKFSC